MRQKAYFWSLFHTTEKNQLDSLATDQVEAIYAAIPKTQRGEWLVWKDGFTSWKPFTQFPDLLVSLRQPSVHEATEPQHSSPNCAQNKPQNEPQHPQQNPTSNPSAPPKSSPPVGLLPANTNTSTNTKPPAIPVLSATDTGSGFDLPLSLDDETSVDERGRGRYEKSLEVCIRTEGFEWRTQTQNVSLQGMQLRDPLPSGLPRFFTVELKAEGRVMALLCSEIKSDDGQASDRIKIEGHTHENALLTLLLA